MMLYERTCRRHWRSVSGRCTQVLFPRTLAELVNSETFEQVWRKAAADKMSERFGGQRQTVTRNMVGDYMGSNEFQQALCKAGGMGMSSIGGMMGNAPPPWPFVGTFMGSEKFQHGTCDMMSQGMIQFGQSVNGWFRSDVASPESEEPVDNDPLRLVDAFFNSKQYDDAKEQLRIMFPDVRF